MDKKASLVYILDTHDRVEDAICSLARSAST
jgi:hypothetical protein